MVFSSTIFLFVFLPLTLLLYFLAGRTMRNHVLLLASLFFYAWGETVYVLLMFVSIICNYLFGRLLDSARSKGRSGKHILIIAICANLGGLGFFKYANFIVEILNVPLEFLNMTAVLLEPVHLPIGISFFTFQAISYIIDLYRNEVKAQKNPFNLALYIASFPQLIAGPIVRYHDVERAIVERCSSIDDIYYGIRRFIIGLGKKVLIANVLGQTADYIFSLPPDRIFMGLAWLGALSYMLQIYYDFSGYSDMAIGLGRIFGFHFPENFNYPYISRSIQEFWRRWHISLSNWFRDYLYIPMGGNRVAKWRVYLNLFVVFLLCGLWHGANWTFVVWGAYYGFFLVLERTGVYRRILEACPSMLRWCYVSLVVLCGWVIFRADSLQHGLSYLLAMAAPGRENFFNSPLFLYLNNEFYFVLVIACIGATPFPAMLVHRLEGWSEKKSVAAACTGSVYLIWMCLVLSCSIASIVSGSYNPFLYFRF